MDKYFNLGKYIYNHRNILALLVISLLLVGCSSDSKVMFLMKGIPESIDTVGDFLLTWFLLQISILLLALLLGVFLGELGFTISSIVHFIWIIMYRDYGFIKVTLLFFLFGIVTYLLSIIRSFIKRE